MQRVLQEIHQHPLTLYINTSPALTAALTSVDVCHLSLDLKTTVPEESVCLTCLTDMK